MVVSLLEPSVGQTPAQVFLAQMMNQLTCQGNEQKAALQGMVESIENRIVLKLNDHSLNFSTLCRKVDVTQTLLQTATEKIAELEISNSSFQRAQDQAAARMSRLEMAILSMPPQSTAQHTLLAPSIPTLMPSMPTMRSVVFGAAPISIVSNLNLPIDSVSSLQSLQSSALQHSKRQQEENDMSMAAELSIEDTATQSESSSESYKKVLSRRNRQKTQKKIRTLQRALLKTRQQINKVRVSMWRRTQTILLHKSNAQ